MSPVARGAIGIDFGTTNTVVSLIGGDGEANLVAFPRDDGDIVAFRSALGFHAPPDDPSGRVVEAGPWAIDAYVEEPLETRFIQSFKSYAASPLFQDTRILGRRYRFEVSFRRSCCVYARTPAPGWFRFRRRRSSDGP